MNASKLKHLVSLYVRGDITPTQHRELADELKDNRQSRTLFRELVDLEFGLSTWANETSESNLTGVAETGFQPATSQSKRWNLNIFIGLAASLLAIATVAWAIFQTNGNDTPFAFGSGDKNQSVTKATTFGTIRQTNCSWNASPFDQVSGQFGAGRFKLTTGVAQLEFDSGTRLTIEGPCELNVDSFSSAKLLEGSVVVNVSELSDGFLLTTPDAEIIDVGTEYGVWMNESATEVHVFDGSVVWQPKGVDEDQADTISAGEANLFSRSAPDRAKRIPFGQRQFVRAMEAEILDAADGQLIAFDGFENLAGKVRRGRSGFGWNGGWQPPGRRKNVGTIVDAPNDKVFGLARAGQKVLRLADGAVIQRQLEHPLFTKRHKDIYVSFVLHRRSESQAKESSFQLAITSGESGRRSRRSKRGIGFGLTSDSLPFVKNGGVINDVAIRLPSEVLFLVARISVNDKSHAQVRLRVYQQVENVDLTEPDSWTVNSSWEAYDSDQTHILLSAGSNGEWEIDHLRIGKIWGAVTTTK